MGLREMAANWCQSASGAADVQVEFERRLDEALQLGIGCSFALGGALTRKRKPYLAHCFFGEFFAFELTPAQAIKLGVRGDHLVCYHSGQQQSHAAKCTPVVHLDEVVLDGVSPLDWSSRINGELMFGSNEFIFQPLVLRAVCEPSGCGAMTLYHHFHELVPSKGRVGFSLASLGSIPVQNSARHTGPLALFFQLWTKNGLVRPIATIVQPSAVKPPRPPGYESWEPPLMTPWILPPYSNPPTWDPPPPPSAPAVPISDIRAVLVEVV